MDVDEFLTDRMRVDAFLADSVDSVNGKLYALGAGWNMVRAKQLPFRHPRIGIGVLVHVPYTATNQPHLLEIRLEDANGVPVPAGPTPEGQPAAPVFRTRFNVGRPPRLLPGEEQIIPVSLNLDGVVFKKADSYRFAISIDGELATTLSLRVVHEAESAPTSTS